jgi:FkbM family methyltransferase
MIDFLLRSLPSFKGKQTIAHLLLRNKIKLGKDLTILGKLGCVYNIPNVQENVGFEIMINGIYEAETINFVCNRIQKNGVFLDVGANIGAISIPICKQRNDIDVICLEAAPWIFEYLNRNMVVNQLAKVSLINKAISDKDGNQVDFFSPRDKFGKGSLAPVFTDKSVKVGTITLDVLANLVGGKKPIDLIKVDVEGFEAPTFRGGRALLEPSNAPDILFEFVDWAEELAGEAPGNAQLVLLNYGYNLYYLENGKIGTQLKGAINIGSYMIFATKKSRM